LLAERLPAAVSIAGGTTLVLDPDAAGVKAVFRVGGVDFVVNTLDEALRVLKNEIRKGQPLSVALVAEVETTLAEMVERGVLPDLFVSLGPLCGMKLEAMEELPLTGANGAVMESERLARWLGERGWTEVVLEGKTTAEVREMDARLVTILQDPVRRTWVQRIGHYQRVAAEGARVVWLTQPERAAMAVSPG
jgi:urocanate hydratase